jgi:hypothetical protein
VCGSQEFFPQVFGERWFLLAPWTRTELLLLRDLVKGYLQRACLVRGAALGVLWGDKMVVVVLVLWGEEAPFRLLLSSGRFQ